jgi:biotin carboxyl carrier protein
MRRPFKWLVGLVVLAGIAAMLTWTLVEGRREIAREREAERPIKVPPRVSRSGTEIVVTLNRPAQIKVALETRRLVGAMLRPEAVAYGRLREDPSQSFTLRVPVAGTLRTPVSGTWPRIGETLKEGAVVGQVDPRLLPVDQVDLATRLATARADVHAAAARLEAAQVDYERDKRLNANNKIVSDKALQADRARVNVEEAKLKAANEIVHLVETSLAATTAPAGARGPLPLAITWGGEVVELFARPGEAVEGGQPLLRVSRFDHLLARVDLPAGQTISPAVSTARIVPLGHEDRSLHGERIMLGSTVDPKTQGQAFVFLVAGGDLALRPGLAVTAYLPVPGEPRKGVVIPSSAVVQFGGKQWAYVQLSDETFTRREVDTRYPTEGGWFMTSGFSPADRIVVTGAQVLLSEELKSQIEVGEEGG